MPELLGLRGLLKGLFRPPRGPSGLLKPVAILGLMGLVKPLRFFGLLGLAFFGVLGLPGKDAVSEPCRLAARALRFIGLWGAIVLRYKSRAMLSRNCMSHERAMPSYRNVRRIVRVRVKD